MTAGGDSSGGWRSGATSGTGSRGPAGAPQGPPVREASGPVPVRNSAPGARPVSRSLSSRSSSNAWVTAFPAPGTQPPAATCVQDGVPSGAVTTARSAWARTAGVAGATASWPRCRSGPSSVHTAVTSLLPPPSVAVTSWTVTVPDRSRAVAGDAPSAPAASAAASPEATWIREARTTATIGVGFGGAAPRAGGAAARLG